MDRLHDWGFPICLLLLWTIAAVFTVYALIGMEAAAWGQTQVPRQSMHVAAKPTATAAPSKGRLAPVG